MPSGFTPVLWPEDEVPADVAGCQKCELCSQRTRIIWGEGNPRAPILVLLDNPGAREDKAGNPFVCGVRAELQLAAFNAGLGMNDLYVTYILKCRPVRRYHKEEARQTCQAYLMRQIQAQKPELAFCLGNTAVQQFFGDAAAEVKSLRGAWHSVRGLPTCVSYHPLAVRRRPNLARPFQQDWEMLARRFFGRAAASSAQASGECRGLIL